MDAQTTDQGYYRHPAVDGDRLVFVSEDDLWEVPLTGGRAERLTSERGQIRHPRFSPDGETLALTGTEEGATEVFVMDADGGPMEQLTYNGSPLAVVGWSRDGEQILFRSTFREPFSRPPVLYSMPRSGGEVQKLEVGKAHAFGFEPDGDGRILGRHSDDLARWKRYRGGTAGSLWVDPEGEGEWEPLLADEEAGLVCPQWIEDRIYFISDRDGCGNVYSCETDGSDLERHTDHEHFYARHLASDGTTLAYTCGGDLYRLEPGADGAEQVEVEYPSTKTQLNRKFVDASDYLHDYTLHPDGHSLAITTRGKLFNFGHWEGAVRQNGIEQGVRYRLPRYVDDDQILVTSDEGGEETFELHDVDGHEEGEPVDVDFDIGRPVDVEIGPDGEQAVFATHRYEIVHLDIEDQEATRIDRSEQHPVDGIGWSPEGRYVAYGKSTGTRTSKICIVDLEEDEIHDVTSGQYRDVDPVFDPEGRYLYFLSCREFTPVYDQVFFELSFPQTMKPCVVTLSDDEDSPFFERPRPLEGTGGSGLGEDDSEAAEDDESGGDENGEEVDAESDESAAEDGDDEDADDGNGEDDEDDEEALDIDFEGLQSRVETFPVEASEYRQIDATAERVFWTKYPIEGSLDLGMDDMSGPTGRLEYYSLDDRDDDLFARKVESFEIGPDDNTMVMKQRGRLRVVNATRRGPAKDSNGSQRPSRDSGWIDLGRVPVSVRPRREWRQMLREAWRLMREHFWREDMGGVEWERVWEQYSPLIDRVSTRSEFSDVVWTMQGELGTSHAYEFGGDYEHPPQYRPGFLGVDCEWEDEVTSEGEGGYRITHIVRGENWEEGASSPLLRPGLDVEEGDVIVAVNGRRLDGGSSLQEALVHRAGEEVDVTIARPERGADDEEASEPETYAVELLRSERRARYREWVRENRERVHEATDGEIGYVHIPDMGPRGYSEFHRAFVSEQSRTGLIVDVRNNGGGHVSQLILEKLARERLGHDVSRWRAEPIPYPSGAMTGPMVALTNEYAGSDGDIFSHCFKQMDLGPLLGKRTWGGVVGILPRFELADGSVTTQPEFASWFEDVGFGLENYGTDPDEEIEEPPGRALEEDDEQLEVAIERAKSRLEEKED
jgi:tricorn protease